MKDNLHLVCIAAMICVTILGICEIERTKYNPYDVNRDGVVSASDYVAIKNYIMSK